MKQLKVNADQLFVRVSGVASWVSI